MLSIVPLFLGSFNSPVALTIRALVQQQQIAESYQPLPSVCLCTGEKGDCCKFAAGKGQRVRQQEFRELVMVMQTKFCLGLTYLDENSDGDTFAF